MEFHKIINPGTIRGKNVFCEIKFDGKNLSITGVVGPRGYSCDSCGQIVDELVEVNLAKDWDISTRDKFINVWKEWHLNDMKAGSPRQEAFIKEWAKKHPYDYTEVCKALEEAGLLIDMEYIYNDKPYKYGTSWLRIEVPADVLKFLSELPETSIHTSWYKLA